MYIKLVIYKKKIGLPRLGKEPFRIRIVEGATTFDVSLRRVR
jgi:hypothetical protein